MTTPNSQNTSSKSGGNIALIIILAVLVILMTVGAGFLGFMYLNNAKVLAETKADNERVEKEKLELDTQLKDLNEQFSKLTEFGNERIDSVVAVKDMEIASLRMQNRSGGGGGSSKLKAKVKALEAQITDLLAQIEKLKQENADLRTANLKLDTEISIVKGENASLSVSNKDLSGKVDLAKQLKISAIESHPIFVSKSGKEKITNKSKKANKIESCFTVFENDVVESGDKTAYLVVIDPTGKLIGENESNVFESQGSEVFYTVKKSFYFDGSKQDMCMDFSDGVKDLAKGNYKISVYIENTLAAKNTFDLK